MILMIAMVLVSGYISYIIHATGGSNYVFHSVHICIRKSDDLCLPLYNFKSYSREETVLSSFSMVNIYSLNQRIGEDKKRFLQYLYSTISWLPFTHWPKYCWRAPDDFHRLRVGGGILLHLQIRHSKINIPKLQAFFYSKDVSPEFEFKVSECTKVKIRLAQQIFEKNFLYYFVLFAFFH